MILVVRLAAIATLVSTVAVAQQAQPPREAHESGERNAPELEPAYEAQFRAPIEVSPFAFETETLAEELAYPWAVEELPGGEGYLVIERPGRLRHISPDGTVSAPIEGVPEVENSAPETGWSTQAGLLDVKAGPNFEEDRMVYLTYSKPMSEGTSATAAARRAQLRLADHQLRTALCRTGRRLRRGADGGP